MAKLPTCPFNASDGPCPDPVDNAGTNPHKQGTLYCMKHGRYSASADVIDYPLSSDVKVKVEPDEAESSAEEEAPKASRKA